LQNSLEKEKGGFVISNSAKKNKNQNIFVRFCRCLNNFLKKLEKKGWGAQRLGKNDHEKKA
jgi:hypothetical protein